MTTLIFSHDEPSALAYEANQMFTAGYEDEAQMIRRQPSLTEWITAVTATITASLSTALFSHDLPAALAYETNQLRIAGYSLEGVQEFSETSRFNQRTTAIHNGAVAIIAWDKKLRKQNAPRSAAFHTIHSYNAR